MAVSLNHTIVHCRDKRASAQFLVGEAEFDQIHGRILERGLSYWADPSHRRAQEINTNDGGRGLYWDDPNGHVLEIITVPYGG